jgi:hypothetical protein
MRCVEFENRLQEMLDQRLCPEDDAQLQAHAVICRKCAETLKYEQALFSGLPYCRISDESFSASRPSLGKLQDDRALQKQTHVSVFAIAVTCLAIIGACIGYSHQLIDHTEVTNRLSSTPIHSEHGQADELQHITDQGRVVDPNEPNGISTDEFEIYRQMIQDITYQMPRFSPDQLRPVNEIASSLQPIASSFTVALGVLKESILVGSDSRKTSPQASLHRPVHTHRLG